MVNPYELNPLVRKVIVVLFKRKDFAKESLFLLAGKECIVISQNGIVRNLQFVKHISGKLQLGPSRLASQVTTCEDQITALVIHRLNYLAGIGHRLLVCQVHVS